VLYNIHSLSSVCELKYLANFFYMLNNTVLSYSHCHLKKKKNEINNSNIKDYVHIYTKTTYQL